MSWVPSSAKTFQSERSRLAEGFEEVASTVVEGVDETIASTPAEGANAVASTAPPRPQARPRTRPRRTRAWPTSRPRRRRAWRTPRPLWPRAWPTTRSRRGASEVVSTYGGGGRGRGCLHGDRGRPRTLGGLCIRRWRTWKRQRAGRRRRPRWSRGRGRAPGGRGPGRVRGRSMAARPISCPRWARVVGRGRDDRGTRSRPRSRPRWPVATDAVAEVVSKLRRKRATVVKQQKSMLHVTLYLHTL